MFLSHKFLVRKINFHKILPLYLLLEKCLCTTQPQQTIAKSVLVTRSSKRPLLVPTAAKDQDAANRPGSQNPRYKSSRGGL